MQTRFEPSVDRYMERSERLSIYNASERHINNNWRNWLKDDERQSRKLSSVVARRLSTTTGRKKSNGDKKRQTSVTKNSQKLLRIMKRNGVIDPNLALLNAKRKKKDLHLFTGKTDEGHGHIVCDMKKKKVVYLRNPVAEAV